MIATDAGVATGRPMQSVRVVIEGRQFVLTAYQNDLAHYEWDCLVAEISPDGALSMWDDPISTNDMDRRQTLAWGVHLLMSYVLDKDGDIT